jgi:hypothetical protein
LSFFNRKFVVFSALEPFCAKGSRAPKNKKSKTRKNKKKLKGCTKTSQTKEKYSFKTKKKSGFQKKMRL